MESGVYKRTGTVRIVRSILTNQTLWRLTNADVDGVLPDAAFEEATAAVATHTAVMLAVAAVSTHGTRC